MGKETAALVCRQGKHNNKQGEQQEGNELEHSQMDPIWQAAGSGDIGISSEHPPVPKSPIRRMKNLDNIIQFSKDIPPETNFAA